MFNILYEIVFKNMFGLWYLVLKIFEIFLFFFINVLFLGGNLLVCIMVYRRFVL